jgi:predicted DsbA family dithiol-disulfide isomerase
VRIDIWSDLVCPWCYLGKRRLELALAGHPLAGEVEIYWHSYELDPAAPADDRRSTAEIVAAKYQMPADEARAGLARLTELGGEVGLEYRFDLTRRASTYDAHRLMHLARDRGLQPELAEALFRAYFTEGRLLSDHDELLDCATGVGLDREEAGAVLTSGAFGNHVRRDERSAAELGVTGVPFFLFEMRYGLAGAKAPEALRQVIDRVAGTGTS